MSEGQGRVLKSFDGRMVFARVRVKVAPSATDELRVTCAPEAFGSLGHAVDLQSPGYVAWTNAAESGVRLAASYAGWRLGAVSIELVMATVADTPDTAVAVAAARAFWDAIGFTPDVALTKAVDELAGGGGPLVAQLPPPR